MMNTHEHVSPIIHGLMLAIFSLFILAMLVVLLAGSQIFSAVDNYSTETDRTRLTLSLVANAIHANDATNAVRVEDGPESDVLVLSEVTSTGTYETRFYLYNGWLVEEYAPAGTELDPTRGTQIVRENRFEVTLIDGDPLARGVPTDEADDNGAVQPKTSSSVELETNEGHVVVALRATHALAGDAA